MPASSRKLFYLFLTLTACTHHEVFTIGKKLNNRETQQLKIMSNDWEALVDLVNSSNLKYYLQQVREINYSMSNCRLDQYACTYPAQYSSIIFLNENYFKQNQIRRMSTLIHEAYHLSNPAIAHQNCANTECDPIGQGAYNAELQFTRKLLDHPQYQAHQVEILEWIKQLKNHLF